MSKPLDPDALPPGGASHDFAERYVIGWSRLTDRKATLPVEKTAQGIEEAVDPAMIRTLKRNQKKLQNQFFLTTEHLVNLHIQVSNFYSFLLDLVAKKKCCQ